MNESAEGFSRLDQQRGEKMRTPDEVAAMLHLVALGVGERQIQESWVAAVGQFAGIWRLGAM